MVTLILGNIYLCVPIPVLSAVCEVYFIPSVLRSRPLQFTWEQTETQRGAVACLTGPSLPVDAHRQFLLAVLFFFLSQ